MNKKTNIALLRKLIESIVNDSFSQKINEVSRGGISAQHTIADKLKKLYPKYDFVSNTPGLRTPDVAVLLKGNVICTIESKSIAAGGKLTSVFDNSVSTTTATVFDKLALALAAVNGIKIDLALPIVGQFLDAIGGSAGVQREVPKKLLTNISKKEYNGFSHKLISKVGNKRVFAVEPIDKTRSNHIIFKITKDGSISAFNTVIKVGNTLVTSSGARAWSSSGKIPVAGGISKDQSVKNIALDIMTKHFMASGDQYFVLVDNDTIYPFITQNSSDPLKLSKLGVPVMTADSFTAAGLSTSGNAGAGKIRLTLKVAFKPSFSL